MSKSIRSSVVDQLETALAELDVIGAAETRIGAIAYLRLAERVKDAISALKLADLRDELASLPPVAGGCDDYEDISEEFLNAPHDWPSDFHPVLDGFCWVADYPGETPLSVLADSDPSAEWDLDPAAWDALEDRWTDADQLVAFGHV